MPQLGSRASPGRARRLCAAQHSQSEAQPLGAQPPPRAPKRAACKVAGFTAFDHLGGDAEEFVRLVGLGSAAGLLQQRDMFAAFQHMAAR